MGKTKFKFLLILTAMAAMLACERMELPRPASAQVVQGAAGGNFNALYNRNKVEILGNLDMLARAMAQRITDAGFGALVKQQASNAFFSNTDYWISISTLKQECSKVGVDLAAQMTTSLTACGGSAAQLQKLPLIADGFMIEGKLFKPCIYVPQLDRTEFIELQSWNGILPEYIGSLATVQGNTIKVYDAAGALHSFTEAQLRLHPTWFVSVMPVDGEEALVDPSPLRFWQLCRCRTEIIGNGPVGFCTTSGDLQPCDRTGLFNNHCSGGIDCNVQ